MKLSDFINRKYFILTLIFGVFVSMDTFVIPSIVAGVTDAVTASNLNLLIRVIILGILGFAPIRLALIFLELCQGKAKSTFLAGSSRQPFSTVF